MKRIIIPLIMIVTLAIAGTALAQSEARKTLDATIDSVLDILSSPGFKTEQRDSLIAKLETEIKKTFDFEEFCTRTVGGKWNDFSSDQKKRFEEAFTDLLYYTYIGSLEKYSGEKIVLTAEHFSTKGDKVEIQTYFPYQGQQFMVYYRMLKKPQGWKVYDVIIENSNSLVQSYRNQFQDILKKQSVDQLISLVEQKAQEKKASNEAAAVGK